MCEIASRALPRNAARTQRGPVMHVGRVVGRYAPGAHFPHDLGGVANTEIKEVVLRSIGAVNVVDRTTSDMLPIEIQKGPEHDRQMILRQDIGLVVGHPHKVLVVGSSKASVRKLRTQHRQTAGDHQTGEDPSGKHRLYSIVELLASNLELLA